MTLRARDITRKTPTGELIEWLRAGHAPTWQVIAERLEQLDARVAWQRDAAPMVDVTIVDVDGEPMLCVDAAELLQHLSAVTLDDPAKLGPRFTHLFRGDDAQWRHGPSATTGSLASILASLVASYRPDTNR